MVDVIKAFVSFDMHDKHVLEAMKVVEGYSALQLKLAMLKLALRQPEVHAFFGYHVLERCQGKEEKRPLQKMLLAAWYSYQPLKRFEHPIRRVSLLSSYQFAKNLLAGYGVPNSIGAFKMGGEFYGTGASSIIYCFNQLIKSEPYASKGIGWYLDSLALFMGAVHAFSYHRHGHNSDTFPEGFPIVLGNQAWPLFKKLNGLSLERLYSDWHFHQVLLKALLPPYHYDAIRPIEGELNKRFAMALSLAVLGCYYKRYGQGRRAMPEEYRQATCAMAGMLSYQARHFFPFGLHLQPLESLASPSVRAIGLFCAKKILGNPVFLVSVGLRKAYRLAQSLMAFAYVLETAHCKPKLYHMPEGDIFMEPEQPGLTLAPIL